MRPDASLCYLKQELHDAISCRSYAKAVVESPGDGEPLALWKNMRDGAEEEMKRFHKLF